MAAAAILPPPLFHSFFLLRCSWLYSSPPAILSFSQWPSPHFFVVHGRRSPSHPARLPANQFAIPMCSQVSAHCCCCCCYSLPSRLRPVGRPKRSANPLTNLFSYFSSLFSTLDLPSPFPYSFILLSPLISWCSFPPLSKRVPHCPNLVAIFPPPK